MAVFSDIFGKIIDNEAKSIWGNAQVLSCRANKEERLLFAKLCPQSFIAPEECRQMESRIVSALRLSRVNLEICYAPELLNSEAATIILRDVASRYPLQRFYLDSAEVRIKDDRLVIALKNGGAEEIQSAKIDSEFAKEVNDLFGTHYDTAFDGVLKVERPETPPIPDEIILPPREHMPEAEVKVSIPAPKAEPRKRIKSGQEPTADMPVYLDSAEVLYGKPIGVYPSKQIDISPDDGEIVVWGEISEFKLVPTRRGTSHRMEFIMTDYTNARKVKAYIDNSKLTELEKLKNGDCVLVRGMLTIDEYDKWDHDYFIKPRDISKLKKYEETDNAELKRVELHAHTNMSMMDATASASDLIKRANKWGHKAIAITDHGVLQAYPDAMNANDDIKKSGGDFKVIYGVEGYLVDDTETAATGSGSFSPEGDFVVFDLETTGFYPSSCSIIEIGAVKLSGREIVGRFSTFVDPGVAIPDNITELTGINDAMVAGAPDEATAVADFLKFAKGCTMVAHNASFDMSFIRSVARRIGVDFDADSIDTVALTRILMPELKNHKLDTVVKALNLGNFNHHRADADAEILSSVFLKLVDMVAKKGDITSIPALNDVLGKADVKFLKRYHIILLVQNMVGLKNLYKLVSHSNIHTFHKMPLMPRSVIDQYREGIIIGSACEQGELYRAVLEDRPEEELLKVADYYDYLEIQPDGNNAFMLREGIVGSNDDLHRINEKIIALGDKLGKLTVATGDVHFLTKRDEILRRIIMAGKGFDDADFQPPLYLKTTNEMLSDFSYLGDRAMEVVVTNTNKIADMIEYIRPIPKGLYPPGIDGAKDILTNVTMDKAHSIYGEELPELIQARLDKELGAIIGNGFEVMYVTAQKLVADSEAHGYYVGSRGSVGSSFVATMMGISEVNPLPAHYNCPNCHYTEFPDDGTESGFDLPLKECPKCGTKLNSDGQNIPFETFLGFEGDKVPDIDLNFSDEYQSFAHKFTEELFGRENVFKAGTIQTIADKTAFGFVKGYAAERGLNLSYAEISRLSALIEKAAVKRTTGQHPGGMVVVPADMEIYDFCPIQHPADDVNSDTLTTHFDFHAIHDNILKLDELGHVIPTIYKYLEEYTGKKVTEVPMNDPKVRQLFISTEPLGVTEKDIYSKNGTYAMPELGTNFVREMLLESQPKTFADLVQISGLSHGTDVWIGNARDLIMNGVCTISEVIGTRDNIMTYLISKGMPNKMSFDIMEIVRKGKSTKLLTDDHKKAMRDAGVPEWYIESCMKIKYMFPKAHASAYMISALRVGWYKVYEPLAFYAAYFTARPDDVEVKTVVAGKAAVRKRIDGINALIQQKKDVPKKEMDVYNKLIIINEMLSRGLEFLPIDLLKSHASKYVIEDGKIRLPFGALGGVGQKAAESLQRAAQKGNFISREELQIEAGVSKTVIEALADAGALDFLPDTNQLSFF